MSTNQLYAKVYSWCHISPRHCSWMTTSNGRIAEAVLTAFDLLPRKAKPREYPNGTREWVPLSGIVLSKDGVEDYTCVSLGTGMRCLPASKVSLAKGYCLHDWHAEIISIRAFNCFLHNECSLLANDLIHSSEWIRRRTKDEVTVNSVQPFAIKDDVRIDMYCSEAPCGDASMELIMDNQTDATPWPLASSESSPARNLNGRGHFSELGVVRRKPARGDAPETKSKSCSDKLALRQCISLLSSISSLLVHPKNAYLRSLILPSNRYLKASIERAFSAGGRMAPVASESNSGRKWSGAYTFRPFHIGTTTEEFRFSRSGCNDSQDHSGSNITAAWTLTLSKTEVLIGGTIQGHKQFSARGGSALCRARAWEAALRIAQALSSKELMEILEKNSYSDVKQCSQLWQRRQVKSETTALALKGWLANNGDDDFSLSA